jgi:hypothetical protein
MTKRVSTIFAVIALCALGFIGLHATVSTPFSYTKATFVNQSASIGATTIASSSIKADYTVFIYSEILNTPCNTNISITVNWTDDNGANTSTPSAANCGTGFGAAPLTIHSAAATTVTISVNYMPGSDNNPYSVFATVLGQ